MSKVRSSLNGYFKAMNFAKVELLTHIQELADADRQREADECTLANAQSPHLLSFAIKS